MSAVRVSELWIYPVKGCRGVSRHRLEFDERGPVGDRRWMVVDDTGRFLTQREHPVLATVAPGLDRDGRLVALAIADDLERCCVVRPKAGATHAARLWSDDLEVIDGGDEAAAWLSELLGSSARLVGQAPECSRTTSTNWTDTAAPVTLADSYPLLLCCTASLDALNDALSTPVPMARFRANVVLEGGDAWQEDAWAEIAIGDLEIDVPKACVRCQVPSVDQLTGERPEPKEPLATLARLHTDERLRGATFGVNAIVRGGDSTIDIGMSVRVVDTH